MDTTIILLAGQYVKGDPSKPLHLCNLYGSKEAGAKLGEMLKMGSSKPWKEAMEVMTGQPEMSTDAMREYFLPLENWLKKENKKNGVRVGWDHDDNSVMCSDQTSTTSQTGQNTSKIVMPREIPIFTYILSILGFPGLSQLCHTFCKKLVVGINNLSLKKNMSTNKTAKKIKSFRHSHADMSCDTHDTIVTP